MRSLKKSILFAAAILLLSLLLGACSDDVKETTPSPTLPNQNPSSQPSQTTVPGVTETTTVAETTTAEALASYPFAPETTGIYLTRDGEIQSAELADFDNSGFSAPRYSLAELRIFVEKRIAAYNEAKGSQAIQMVDLSLKDTIAQLILSYASIEDFMAFQGEDFGIRHLDLLTRENAVRNYDIGNLVDTEGNRTEILKALQARDAKVLVISGKTHVTVNGNISYLSANMILTGRNSARCDSDQDYSFIIFR
ncbi:MAG: hypothetical protein J5496_02245 [Lachnospiraceae bacterium]|nr:hypothetical protein [Lachnospiraceae bacterium]